jgi:hypothetical protein
VMEILPPEGLTVYWGVSILDDSRTDYFGIMGHYSQKEFHNSWGFQF